MEEAPVKSNRIQASAEAIGIERDDNEAIISGAPGNEAMGDASSDLVSEEESLGYRVNAANFHEGVVNSEGGNSVYYVESADA